MYKGKYLNKIEISCFWRRGNWGNDEERDYVFLNKLYKII